MNFKFFITFVAWLTFGESARILVYIPAPSVSHQVVFRPLVQELAKRGHEVVHITTDPVFPPGQAPSNLTEIDLHDRSYNLFREVFLSTARGNKDDIMDEGESSVRLMYEVFYDQLEDSAVKEVIFGKQKFDLLILEGFIRPIIAVSHIHKVPTILGNSVGPMPTNLETIGAPTHPFLYPNVIRQKLYNLTIWDKIKELYYEYKINSIFNNIEPEEHEELKKYFGDDLPTPTELLNNVDMLFLNIHPIFQGNYPVPPSVVYIWGIHKKIQKELPQDLKTYLDDSKNGVIYMSLGTNTDPSKLPPNVISTFINVFCKLPYDILFKWDKDQLPGHCDNVKFGKWFPQSDLLKHPKIKLFITQGGLQSTEEALTAKVPLVGIPMMGDQWYNVEKYVHFKIGVQVDADTITEEKLMEAITTVIEDDTYRRNIEKLDKLMRDEPMPALERAAWWVEHVLRHGGARHLRSPAANISWAQYLELELVAVVIIALLVSATLVLLGLNFIIKLLFSGKTKTD